MLLRRIIILILTLLIENKIVDRVDIVIAIKESFVLIIKCLLNLKTRENLNRNSFETWVRKLVTTINIERFSSNICKS